MWSIVCAHHSAHHASAPPVSVWVVSGGRAALPSVCSVVTVQQWSCSLASESAQESGSQYVQTARVMCLVSASHDCLSKLTLQQICWVFLVVEPSAWQEKANHCWLGNVFIYSYLVGIVGKCFSQSKNCLPNSITSVLNLQSTSFKVIWL